MRAFSDETLRTAEAIADAGRIVVFGAKQTARELLPACESLAPGTDITVAVSHLPEGGPRFLEGYPIREAADVVFDRDTLVLAAMSERFFPEVARMPELQGASRVLYLSLAEVVEVKRYAAIRALKRLGLDVRLFDRLCAGDLFTKSDISCAGYPSVKEKMWELAVEESARYVMGHMRRARSFTYRSEYHAWLRETIRACQTPHGINLEFGVAAGDSLRKFAGGDVNPFYGFDSFEGLPEEWFPAEAGGLSKAAFWQEGLPQLPENTVLVKGWFEDTLPCFVSETFGPSGGSPDVNFIHVDCDLYASARTVFDCLHPYIRRGTVIAFDEYLNYPGWQMDEFKAFQEYVTAHGVSYEYLAYVERNSQACVRIL